MNEIIPENICILSDSYKVGAHWNMYVAGTEKVYAYYEARLGSLFEKVVWIGIQLLLKKHLSGKVVTREKIEEAALIAEGHFGNDTSFNRAGWEYILEKHGGKLPIRIKAVREGTRLSVSNVLMTVENTDDNCAWLTNYLESILSHIWYMVLTATLLFEIKQDLKQYFVRTADDLSGLDFIVHGFGFRSYTCPEQAQRGSLCHVALFKGTDDILALKTVKDYYNHPDYKGIAYSVPASEHSIMTSLGRDGESDMVGQLLSKYQKGILSVVGDSYDIYNFVTNIVGVKFKEDILRREGVFVVRPDSTTPTHPTKPEMTLWIVKELGRIFGETNNSKGFKVINSKVRVLYGDGLNRQSMNEIASTLENAGYSISNIATFGAGSGLVQKDLHRDVIRAAFKCSYQVRSGRGFKVNKQPLDITKASKAGILKLLKVLNDYKTVNDSIEGQDYLNTIFLNGDMVDEISFIELRENLAKLFKD